MIDITPLNKHGRAALAFSGGKDSLACLWLLRDQLDRITVYHLDTGDTMPETRHLVSEIEAVCPNFVHIQGDVRAWIAGYGHPSDLLPFSTHGIGAQAGQDGAKLVTRYQCCFVNLMWPVWDRIKADGHTLLIRGTKLVDMPRLPMRSGEMEDGIELWLPVENWSDADVLTYLRGSGSPWSPLYDALHNSPDCARCTAWMDEGRGAYLRANHPELFLEYAHDLKIVASEVAKPINALRRELAEVTA